MTGIDGMMETLSLMNIQHWDATNWINLNVELKSTKLLEYSESFTCENGKYAVCIQVLKKNASDEPGCVHRRLTNFERPQAKKTSRR